jgi:hypothetical protein
MKYMKKFLTALLLTSLFLAAEAQSDKAALKSSSRLFKVKEDLTSVILIIPKDSIVAVLGSDSTYLKVAYQNNEGYIFRRDALLIADVVITTPPSKPQTIQAEQQVPATSQSTRYKYLEGKYGTTMGTRLYERKIWKGMNSGMLKDSWGPAQKITRQVDGNLIKEEWLYNKTWLYLENNMLIDWGPIKQ